jgi:hypothetical protein
MSHVLVLMYVCVYVCMYVCVYRCDSYPLFCFGTRLFHTLCMFPSLPSVSNARVCMHAHSRMYRRPFARRSSKWRRSRTSSPPAYRGSTGAWTVCRARSRVPVPGSPRCVHMVGYTRLCALVDLPGYYVMYVPSDDVCHGRVTRVLECLQVHVCLSAYTRVGMHSSVCLSVCTYACMDASFSGPVQTVCIEYRVSRLKSLKVVAKVRLVLDAWHFLLDLCDQVRNMLDVCVCVCAGSQQITLNV